MIILIINKNSNIFDSNIPLKDMKENMRFHTGKPTL